MIYSMMFTTIAKWINAILSFSLYAFYSLLGLSLAHNVITDKLVRSFIYNQFKYISFTAPSGLSLAHINF